MISDSLIYCCKKLEWIDVLSPNQINIYFEQKTLENQINYLLNFIRVKLNVNYTFEDLDDYESLLKWSNDKYILNEEGIVILYLGKNLNKGYPFIIKNGQIDFGNQYSKDLWEQETNGYKVCYIFKDK
jgi:hypothetical protein